MGSGVFVFMQTLWGPGRVEECGQRIFERIIAVASGERPKSEVLGYGEEEFCPWDLGIML